MGTKKGWRTIKRGNSWRADAWDPQAGKYLTKTYRQAEDAAKWAADQHARFRTRVEILSQVTTEYLVRDHLAELRRLGRSDSHVDDMERTLIGAELKPGETRDHLTFVEAVPDIAHRDARSQVRAWLSGQTDICARTRNKHLGYALAIGNWAVEERHMVSNPLIGIKPESYAKTLKPQFTISELRTITNSDHLATFTIPRPKRKGRFSPDEETCLRTGRDPFHPRACLMLYAGLRAEEVVGIRAKDIDLGGKMLRAFGKGQKERLVPMQDELAAVLRPLVQAATDPEAPLLILDDKNQRRTFQDFLERWKIPRDGRSPHSLRHGYAGLMTATGTPSLLLQAYMGHVSNATTGDYAKLSSKYAAAVQDWPRGEFRFRQKLSTILHIVEPQSLASGE